MNGVVRSVAELAALVRGNVVGDRNVTIRSVASLESAGEGDIAYVDDEKFFERAARSKASCVIVSENARLDLPCQVQVKNPKLAARTAASITCAATVNFQNQKTAHEIKGSE
jgi:UDP-3-O-[3-hydroxymyristoyl] glucosamine N-acyltransferase